MVLKRVQVQEVGDVDVWRTESAADQLRLAAHRIVHDLKRYKQRIVS